MGKYNINPRSWRPPLGYWYIIAVLEIVKHINAGALEPISPLDYIRKLIARGWAAAFPDKPFPGDTIIPRFTAGPDVHST